MQGGIGLGDDLWQPVVGATEDLDVCLLLIDQNVIFERFQFHVGPEFFPAIDALGGRRENFEDHLGFGRDVVVTR